VHWHVLQQKAVDPQNPLARTGNCHGRGVAEHPNLSRALRALESVTVRVMV
jgi:hypothetical protein